jgi:uncharacterized membrane protein YhaH (DUF805 family)
MYPLRVIFSFRGRIGRRDYWLIGFPAWIAALSMFVLAANTTGDDAAGFVFLLAPFALAVWVAFAIVSKRFRDSGVSGWWAFAMLVPLIGVFVPIIAGATATDSGEAEAEEA